MKKSFRLFNVCFKQQQQQQRRYSTLIPILCSTIDVAEHCTDYVGCATAVAATTLKSKTAKPIIATTEVATTKKVVKRKKRTTTTTTTTKAAAKSNFHYLHVTIF